MQSKYGGAYDDGCAWEEWMVASRFDLAKGED